jgi:hypothetical protein
VGLSGEIEDARSLQEATVQKGHIPQAEKVLGQILDLSADAERVSAKYKRSMRPDDSSLTTLNGHRHGRYRPVLAREDASAFYQALNQDQATTKSEVGVVRGKANGSGLLFQGLGWNADRGYGPQLRSSLDYAGSSKMILKTQLGSE